MTNSEKLLSSFSENYFYKELVYADLKFTPTGGTEIELADLIINLEDIILAIQLKERNEKDRTQDKNIEEKWLKKKCKKAKEQIKDTISYITSEKVSFINARGKKTIINPSAEVVPLVVFENDSISEYEHLWCSYIGVPSLFFPISTSHSLGLCTGSYLRVIDDFTVMVSVRVLLSTSFLAYSLNLFKLSVSSIDISNACKFTVFA